MHLAYHRMFFFLGKKRKIYFKHLVTCFWHDHQIYYSTALQLRVVATEREVLSSTEVSTGAYRHFQRFALEAPVLQTFKHKGGACQYLSGFSDFG